MTSNESTAIPELNTRSIIVGLLVAMIIGSAYPYCVLKLGFGPNLSVVSAFLGFIALVLNAGRIPVAEGGKPLPAI